MGVQVRVYPLTQLTLRLARCKSPWRQDGGVLYLNSKKDKSKTGLLVTFNQVHSTPIIVPLFNQVYRLSQRRKAIHLYGNMQDIFLQAKNSNNRMFHSMNDSKDLECLREKIIESPEPAQKSTLLIWGEPTTWATEWYILIIKTMLSLLYHTDFLIQKLPIKKYLDRH